MARAGVGEESGSHHPVVSSSLLQSRSFGPPVLRPTLLGVLCFRNEKIKRSNDAKREVFHAGMTTCIGCARR